MHEPSADRSSLLTRHGKFPSGTPRHAFTRLEALVLLMICLCTLGMTFIVLVHHRENAQREQCKHHLKRMGEALRVYNDTSAAQDHERRLPPSHIAPGYATWAVLLAPYLIKETPLLGWDLLEPYSAQKDQVREARVIPFFCPSRSRKNTLSQRGDTDALQQHLPGALGDYAAVFGDGSDNDGAGLRANGSLVGAEILERKDSKILRWKSQTSLAMLEGSRGTAYTLLIGEKHVPVDHQGDAAFGDGSLYNGQHLANFARVVGVGFPLADSMTAPFNNNFGSSHRNVSHFLFADTRVFPMVNHTSETVLGELAKRGN